MSVEDVFNAIAESLKDLPPLDGPPLSEDEIAAVEAEDEEYGDPDPDDFEDD